MSQNIRNLIKSGQIARLIPSVSDSKREEKATSCLLATMMVVPRFAQSILEDVGAPIGKRSKIRCYTEVVFKSKAEKSQRPDGLVIITNGSKEWSALVESKVGAAELNKDQIDEYLDLAKELGIDSVITFSNQFATLPTHHPVSVQKQKLRNVSIFHFSWLSLVSKAILVTENKEIEDTEQGYILNELVRYLQHDASGVTAFSRMSSSWKDLCAAIQQGAVLNKNDKHVLESVASWQQLLRYLSIQMSVATAKHVKIHLSRTRTNDPELNFQEDVLYLLKNNALSSEFDIPDAAARIEFTADLLRRTVSYGMKVDAPKDRSRATASINWLLRQIKDVEEKGVNVRAFWPKRIPMTTGPLESVLNAPEVLIPPNVSELPTSFEVVEILDLSRRFVGARSFVEDVEKALPQYYANVGQKLNKWVPKPPRVIEVDKKEHYEDIKDEEELQLQTGTEPIEQNDNDSIQAEPRSISTYVIDNDR
jgi:hypothetical protein